MTILSLSESGGDTVTGWEYDETQTIRCQITPEKPSVAFERWGIESVEQPHLLLCNVPDGQLLKYADRIRKSDGREFKVMAPPQVWDAESSTSCMAFMVDEVIR